MTLEEWMHAEGLDDEEVGRRVGRDRATINRIRRGTAVPSAELIAMLVKLTCGRVPAGEFLPTVELPKVARR